MNRLGAHPIRRALAAAAIAVALSLALLGAYLAATADERAMAARVRRLVEKVDENYLSQDNAAFEELQSMGAAAYPELRAILAWRETAWHRAFEKGWGRAPARIRNLFPQPGQRRVLQLKVSAIVPELGPAACRGVASAAAGYILRNEHPYGTVFPLRMLYWSVPESPEAMCALEHWLSRWDRETHLFGMLYAYELWPRMPQLAPALAQWLRNPDAADEAAASLGTMGRGAESAVPLLLEMAGRGVVGTNTNTVVIAIDRPMDRNRAVALHALASIGVTNREVQKTIERSLRDENLDVAVAALLAAGQLGWSFEDHVPAVLGRHPLAATRETKMLAERLGALGPRANAALPWLRKLAAEAQTLPAPPGDRGGPPMPPQEMEVAAIAAICQIDDSEIPHRLPALIKHFAGRWEAADVLLKSGTASREIVGAVEPLLQHRREVTRLQAATVILKHDPLHEKARSILMAGMAADDWEMGLTAAYYHCRAGLDPEPLMPLLRKGLLMDGDLSQTALNSVELMGERARPLIPELRRCIAESKNSGARDWAGRILRRIAPGEMPPIR